MERRDFMKFVAALPVATVPLGISFRDFRPHQPANFDPRQDYGRVIFFSSWNDGTFANDKKAGLRSIRDYLIEDAKRFLSFGSRFEIRRAIPENLGREHQMGWIYSPGFGIRRFWHQGHIEPEEFDSAMGVFMFGRYVA